MTPTATQLLDWQTKPLCRRYSVVIFDTLNAPLLETARSARRGIHLAVGKHVEGLPEIIDIWVDDDALPSGRTNAWRASLERLQQRGVERIDVVAADDATVAAVRFQHALRAAFPASMLRGSIAHLLRNSLLEVSTRDRKPVAAALRSIFTAQNARDARTAMRSLSAGRWARKYPSPTIHWDAMSQLVDAHFALPRNVRRLMIAAADATEDWHRQLQRRMHSSDTYGVHRT